jgi:hypothetical protein
MHGHRRRDFMTTFGCAALWPFASSARQAAIPIVGFVNPIRILERADEVIE